MERQQKGPRVTKEGEKTNGKIQMILEMPLITEGYNKGFMEKVVLKTDQTVPLGRMRSCRRRDRAAGHKAEFGQRLRRCKRTRWNSDWGMERGAQRFGKKWVSTSMPGLEVGPCWGEGSWGEGVGLTNFTARWPAICGSGDGERAALRSAWFPRKAVSSPQVERLVSRCSRKAVWNLRVRLLEKPPTPAFFVGEKVEGPDLRTTWHFFRGKCSYIFLGSRKLQWPKM